jgi:hypothetical protein
LTNSHPRPGHHRNRWQSTNNQHRPTPPRAWLDPWFTDSGVARLSTAYQITPPKPEWQPHFQVRVLTGHQPRLRGMFTYPEPFDRT